MDKIDELLTRGVDTVYPTKEELEKVLRNGKKLRLYQGFDPTGTQLHIGHMVGLRKLRQWQDLGHHVIFLIGDGTGQAGDPSGKTKGREKFHTREELRANAVDYVKQASKIVRFEGENPVEILFNGDWLSKLNYSEILELLGHASLQQLMERDLFQNRMKQGEQVNMREFIYPLLQGYDSVAMKVDLELGGSDQMFNMLCGRTLVKAYLNKDKLVMTTPLLADSKGQKIGKTEGNAIALNDIPEDLYAKIMTFPDDVITKAFEYLTDEPMDSISEMKKKMEQGENPMTFKKKLAFDLVKQLNNLADAERAQKTFESQVQKDELPTEIPEFEFDESVSTVTDAIVVSGFALSKSDARRLIEQGGVTVDNEVIEDINAPFKPVPGTVLRVGKRKFLRVK